MSFYGGLEGIRTLDPHNANVVRSQLRYKPMTVLIISPPEPFVKPLLSPYFAFCRGEKWGMEYNELREACRQIKYSREDELNENMH